MLRPSRREILVLVRQGLCELCSFQVVELALEIAGERRGVVVGVVEDARGGIGGRVPPRFAEAGVILVELGVRVAARAVDCARLVRLARRDRRRGEGLSGTLARGGRLARGKRARGSVRDVAGGGTLRRLGRRAPRHRPKHRMCLVKPRHPREVPPRTPPARRRVRPGRRRTRVAMMVVRQSKQSRAVNEPPTPDLGRARTNAHSTARERVREMGVGVSDDDDDVIIVGETLARADSDDAPPSKRARPDEAPSRPVESLGNNASAGETTRDPPLFRLFTTRGLRDEHNRGCASLADVISGPVRWAVAMNYMVDGAYLAAACPSLFRIPRVVWIHGQDDISSYTPRPSGWTLHKPPSLPTAPTTPKHSSWCTPPACACACTPPTSSSEISPS